MALEGKDENLNIKLREENALIVNSISANIDIQVDYASRFCRL